jgi:hypothetical protein
MSEDLFISWFSPDRDVVMPVINRLTHAGMQPMEYSHETAQGDAGDLVNGYIKRARLAVFFISKDSAKRDWMAREVAWVYKERRDRAAIGHAPPAVLPITLGRISPADLPGEIADYRFLKRLELPATNLTESQITGIVEKIVATMGMVPPRVIPVALLAMTKKQAEQFLPTLEKDAAFKELCGAVGMKDFPQLGTELLSRYRENSDDFSPFEGENTLKQTIDVAIERINLTRPKESPRLWLWWSTAEQLDGQSPYNKRLRDYVRQGASILILDAVTMCDGAVRDRFLAGLPQPGPKGRRATLWVPPYTKHTSRLQRLTQTTMRNFVQLMTLFDSWELSDLDPTVPFDLATVPALQAWVYNAVRSIEGVSMALVENTSAFAEAFVNAPKRAPQIGGEP